MLNYQEAGLFLRFGEDMRFDEWPAGDFIRIATADSPPPVGYQKAVYIPTTQEANEAKWRKA